MCHTGSCKHESYDGDCKVSGRLPDDCLLRDDDYEEVEPDYDPVEEYERQERRYDRRFTMDSVARMSGLNY